MQAEMTRPAIDGQADETLLGALWQSIQRHLEAEKERIFQEIRYYPPPIPACDVQFNSLLEERAAILQAVGQVNGILKQKLSAREHIELLEGFITSSQHLPRELVESIRQSLPKLLA